MIGAHCTATRQALREPGEYLVIEDTTSLDFSTHHATASLGRTGDDHGRGFFLHASLALRMLNGEPEMIGLYRQQAWARGDDFHCVGRPRSERLSRQRESQRWGQLELLEHDLARLPKTMGQHPRRRNNRTTTQQMWGMTGIGMPGWRLPFPHGK